MNNSSLYFIIMAKASPKGALPYDVPKMKHRNKSKDHAATGFFFNVTGSAINWAESNQNKPSKTDTIIDKLEE